jgi:hypothetical protein
MNEHPGKVRPANSFPIGQRLKLPGHFPDAVVLESVRPIGGGYECRVRLPDGTPDEAILSHEEASILFGQAEAATTRVPPVDAEKVRLLIESARIRLAYAHDRQFAVSLSGIRTLPHQIEAVYLKMLPQPRLRFLLADDPGAGKTIMAGLLLKELKLREAIERILIMCPAPLTIQWQDELLRWFGEPFDIIFSAVDQQQLVNPWQRCSQVITSLDYAKQDDVRERVWQQHWDLIIIDEAHKCSAYTKHSIGRGDEPEKTKRYQLAEKLSAQADNLLLLTATPHRIMVMTIASRISYDSSTRTSFLNRTVLESRLATSGETFCDWDPTAHGHYDASRRISRISTAAACFRTATPTQSPSA